MATVFQESTQTGKLRARANTTFKCAKCQTGNKTFWAKTRAPFQEPQNHSECMDIAKDLDFL